MVVCNVLLVLQLFTELNIHKATLLSFIPTKINHYRKSFYDFGGRNVLTLAL